MKVRLIKHKELEDAKHPHNIEEGYNEEFYVDPFSFKCPEVGERFSVGHFSTSAVQEILDENTIKTLNSIYVWRIIQDNRFLDCDNRIDIQFSNNKIMPAYGENAYCVDSHTIQFPIGRNHKFKSSRGVVEKIKSKLTDEFKNHFHSIQILKWKKNSCVDEIIKNEKDARIETSIDKLLIEKTFFDLQYGK